ncbi:MAG: MaoC family dehydratase N-terminal domain-containing protein [Halioglobus sp.]
MSADPSADWQAWVGRRRSVEDVISSGPLDALAATLDMERAPALPGDALPCCWHWLYFQQPTRASQLDVDGHPLRGEFLPPVSLPRRMWAGSRLRFHTPLRVGDRARRESTILAVDARQGRSGALVFVRLQHEVYRGEALALSEEQDLVFRERPTSNEPPRPTGTEHPEAQWSRRMLPDAVLLFRYSALTFNAHRIHYDREYAVDQEGYGGLVVQGPLTATLLLEVLRNALPEVQVERFAFRGLRPLLDTGEIVLSGRREGNAVQLWALDSKSQLAMQANALISCPT